MEEGKIKIIIGADIVPTNKSQNAFSHGLMDELLGKELYTRLLNADIRIFNLEVPLTDIEIPIHKCGPKLIAPKSTINGIEKLKPSLLTLANNHIMDQGEQGLISTTSLLTENGISFCGVGLTEKDAQQSWIKSINGVTIGVYACAEHEFSIAEDDKPGANPVGAHRELECIQQLKEKSDYVIVLYHGGKENYRYPSPKLQKRGRIYIDNGADFVICQHSHCIGCEEYYKQGRIVYGQGDFLFEKRDNEYWNTSLLIEINIEKDKIDVEYLPLVKCSPGMRLASESKREEILAEFYKRSNQIKDDVFVKKNYEIYSKEMLYALLFKMDIFSNTVLFRILNKISGGKFKKWYVSHFVLKRKGVEILNLIECEAWNELLVTGLHQYIKCK